MADEHVYYCEVVIAREPGMKIVGLKTAARMTYEIAGREYPQHPDMAAFDAIAKGGAIEMTFELRQNSAEMSGAAVRALTLGRMIVERAGYGVEPVVLGLKVEVA